jgi:hypothetical protein
MKRNDEAAQAAPQEIAWTALSWFDPRTPPRATTDETLLIVFRGAGEVVFVERAFYDPEQFGWIVQGGRHDGEYIRLDRVRAWANAAQVVGRLFVEGGA